MQSNFSSTSIFSHVQYPLMITRILIMSFKYIKLFRPFIIALCCLISSVWGITAFASIQVVSGGSQSIDISTVSEEIFFKVTAINDANTVLANRSVSFSLTAPNGSDVSQELVVTTGHTDSNGMISTRVRALNTLGEYTLTAVETLDVSQKATTLLTVVAGQPSVVIFTQGQSQAIPATKRSSPIRIRLSDGLANIAANQTVKFDLINSGGSSYAHTIIPSSINTNAQGEAEVYINAPDIDGTYTLSVTWQEQDKIVSATTPFTVLAALPSLPSLGFAIGNTTTGEGVETNSSFNGGATINNTAYTQEAILSSQDEVVIKAYAEVETAHVGQEADLIVVIGLTPLPLVNQETEQFYMIEENGGIIPWSGVLAEIATFKKQTSLPKYPEFTLFSGQLGSAAYRIFVGYRLKEGTIIFNGQQSINLFVTP